MNCIAAINIRYMEYTEEEVIAVSLRLTRETPHIMDEIRRMQGANYPINVSTIRE